MNSQFITKMRQLGHQLIVGFFVISVLTACASSYEFVSQPPGAQTFLIFGSEKKLLGETPLEFSKSDLPSSDPFMVSLEKDGYQPRQVSILPTNQTHTTVRVSLVPTVAGTSDAGLARMRSALKMVLDAQEKVARRNYVGALAALSELEKSEPNLAEIFVIRGSVYTLLKRPQDARIEWKRALALDPSLEILKSRIAEIEQSASSE